VTPHDFIAKWRPVELRERAAARSHFNDLCRLLGLDDPVTADPKGDRFTFEKGASKTTGGEGWADVWRKGCFGWEYKGRHKNLDPHMRGARALDATRRSICHARYSLQLLNWVPPASDLVARAAGASVKSQRSKGGSNGIPS
jgi:hypothetical protein